MSKLTKRMLSIALVIALCFGLGPVFKLELKPKAAEDETFTYEDYECKVVDGSVWITKYNGSSDSVSIPGVINGLKVIKIGRRAFAENTTIRTVSIPSSVEEIGKAAFCLCNQYQDYTPLPDNMHDQDEAYYNTIGLNKVVFDKESNLKIIDEGAFANCYYLESITLPESVKVIGEQAFYECIRLNSIGLPNKIEELNYCCFGETSISSITLPKTVKVADAMFAYYLESLDNDPDYLPDYYKYVQLPSSRTITFEEGLEFLPRGVFRRSQYVDIKIPDTIKTIGQSAFENAKSLNSITIPKSVERIEQDAFCGSGIESVIFEADSKLKTIDYQVFADCINLKRITIPKSVELINHYAFVNTRLESVVFESDSSLKTIESYAFSSCPYLKEITIPRSVEYIAPNAFFQNWNTDVITLETIYGYSGTVAEEYANEHDITFIPIDDSISPIGKSIKTIGFKYLSTYKDKDKNEIEGATYCYYSDDYFSDNPFEDGYNASLATMSMALAWSAFNSPEGGKQDYSNKFKNAKELLGKIGMTDIEANSMYSEKPYSDSIGVICGNKPIIVNGENYTLIACAVRGGGYETEWASNFTVGKSGEHEGFATAKKIVLNYLKEYISDKNINGRVKFWITGYSRAAATANLTAAAIDDGSAGFDNSISYAPEDVFAYTFETPAGAIDNVKSSKIYDNIFNIINPSDPVPYVAPSRIGFGRYGIDYYYPTIGINRKYRDLKRNMKAVFDSLPYSDLLVSDSNKRVYDRVDNFEMKKINYDAVKSIQLNASGALSPVNSEIVIDDLDNFMFQSYFLSDFFDIIADDVMIDRNNFVIQYQDLLRDFFRITNGNSEIYKQFFKELKKINIIRKALTIISPDPLVDVLLDCLFACFAVSASDPVPNKAELLDLAKRGAPLIYRLIQADPDYFATLISNADGIGCGHYPELCFSWVASMDKNYNPNAKVTFTPFAYRKVRINCDVNVSVYDSNNSLVAQINNEKATDLNNDYMYGIDNDGQKYVILPIDEDYTIEIQAYNDTVVNYGVSEYSADAGTYTRNVNFFDIKLDKDEKLTGDISSYLHEEIETDTMHASHATYTIKDTNDVVVKASSDLKDEESVNATYYVDASSSNDEHGLVYGAGSHQFGHYAQLEAAARKGYKFIGWFIDNDLVSAESSYRFRVESDIKVIGQFDKLTDDSESQNVDTKLNGIVQGPGGKWAMYKEGIVDTSATGVFQNKYGWWRVEKGYVNFDAQGIYQNQFGWWKTTNGKVTFKENGIFQNGYGWWRVKDSKVDFKAQGIYQNQYGWWKTTNGKVTFKENGVVQNENGWWKVKDSKVDFNFTGIASNKYGSWYIKTGKVDFNKNGKVKYNNKTYNIKNGKVV